MRRLLAVFGPAILAFASTASAQYFQPPSPVDAARSAGRQIYMKHCAVCHAWRAGVPVAQGPTLVGVVGRPAASVPGFPYSDALKTSKIVWTEDNLKKWLADDTQMAPGTTMPNVSIADPVEQIYAVEFLKTLKAPRSATAP